MNLYCRRHLFRLSHNIEMSVNRDHQHRSLIRSQILSLSLACHNKTLQNVSDSSQNSSYKFVAFVIISNVVVDVRIAKIFVNPKKNNIRNGRIILTFYILNITAEYIEIFEKICSALKIYAYDNILQQCRKLSYSFGKQCFLHCALLTSAYICFFFFNT